MTICFGSCSLCMLTTSSSLRYSGTTTIYLQCMVNFKMEILLLKRQHIHCTVYLKFIFRLLWKHNKNITSNLLKSESLSDLWDGWWERDLRHRWTWVQWQGTPYFQDTSSHKHADCLITTFQFLSHHCSMMFAKSILIINTLWLWHQSGMKFNVVTHHKR